MKRRQFLIAGAGLLCAPLFAAENHSNFQYCMLKVGKNWEARGRALIKLSFEVQKRCNIPVETDYIAVDLDRTARVNSPFYILSGDSAFDPPTVSQARGMRFLLDSGGVLLFDDFSDKGDSGFHDSALEFMARVYPEQPEPGIVPNDHAVYQSYYLLKEPRGRLDNAEYLEGWGTVKRTTAFFSHNDLLGALEADRLGNWRYPMEIGGGFRRELCFRFAINLTYYTLTLNYKKDRAFPPIIERRRRI